VRINALKKPSGAVDSLMEGWALFSHRHCLLIFCLMLLVAAATGRHALKLKLVSDFESMLPENYQSVKDLRLYQKEVGSTSVLSIGLMSRDIEAARGFADDLAAALQEDMGSRIHYVEYNIKDVRMFFRENALLYADTDELNEKYRSLSEYIGKRKLEATGFLADIEEDEDRRPPLGLERLIERLNGKAAGFYGTGKDGYYTNEAEDLLAMTVYPRPEFTGIENARLMVDEIDRIIKRLSPEKYAPDLKAGLAGPVRIGLDEYDAIKKDIIGTLAVCISLVALIIFIYFLRTRPLLLIGATLFVGLTLTMGMTRLAIGYLNAQTAFLGSIIVGTGINYGIIFLARYTEERRMGREPLGALRTSMVSTWRATLSAAVTTAVAFGTLGFSENLSFRQFGFIAGIGIVIIWSATMLFLPSMTALSEKLCPMIRKGGRTFEISFVPHRAARLIVSKPNVILAAGAGIVILSAVFIIRWLPDSLEYDFRNLRNKMTFRSGVEALDHRIVGECTHQGTAPLAVVTKSLDEAAGYCRAIEEKKKRNPEKYAAGACRTLKTFLPEKQEEKIALLRKMDKLLERNEGLLPSDLRQEYETYGGMLRVKALAAADLPETIKRKFRNTKGQEGVVAVVYPVPDKNIWVYENLSRFVGTARKVETEDGKIITASGAPIIFFDLVQTVAHDAPRDTLYAMVGVFIVVLVIVGRIRNSLSLTVTLAVAIAAMVGMAAISGTKINFFNFVAIPTAFGTGADYGINILMRYLSERGRESRAAALRRAMVMTGGAVFLCSSTTIIGYFSLMTSSNQALVSYGKLAMAGEIGCLLAAVLLLPAVIMKLKC
jgi:predicted RND superfamily exporter protein